METSHKKDEKRSKHKKKCKKHEKEKYKSERHKETDSESSEEEQWVEASTSNDKESKNERKLTEGNRSSGEPLRDDWMNVSTFIPTISRKELKDKKRKETESASLSTIDKPGQHGRELNPYWKDGGTGLPSEKSDKTSSSNVSLPEKSVGDAGVNWLQRAYQRIEEQAKEENRSMEEIAAERWGSLEKLENLLSEAKTKAKKNNYFDRRTDSKQPKWRKPYDKHQRREFFEGRKEDTKFRNSNETCSNEKDTSCKRSFKKPDVTSDSIKSTSEERKMSRAPKWMKKEYFNHPPKETSEETDHKAEDTAEKSEDLPKEDQLLSDKEMNELGAKLIKAEMLGRKEQAERLKAQLELARQARESSKSVPKSETVILIKTDKKGFTQPLSNSVQTEFINVGRKKKKQVDTHDRGGKRVCYFPDDDKYSIKQMFEKEKMTSVEDNNAEFARLCGKIKDDDDDFMDEASKIKPCLKRDHRDRSQAIQDNIRLSAALEKCQYCLDSPHMKKHLIVAIGIKTYLALPGCISLTEGHCYIIPMAHVMAGTLLDEDIWAEIKVFRKGLTKMFEDLEKVAIFLETSMHHKRQPHTIIECIPLPKEEGALAPFYFKKAIQECETEWAMNKKLIDLYQKDLLHSVPRGLPYMSVEFGSGGGFAHVIEDEKRFPSNFGREVIGGMLDADPSRWRKPVREKFEDQTKKVLEFSKLWKPYDWTERLKEGNK